MKVLIVDDDIDFRGLAGTHLRRHFPRVIVSEYDPEVLGLPRSDFPWADFDVVILDHELRSEHTGLDWLRRYAALPGAPAVIFATGTGNDQVAAEAIKLGAADYLGKRDMTSSRLAEMVNTAIAKRQQVDERFGGAQSVDSTLAECLSEAGFDIRHLIGCGGTSDVYLAERSQDHQTVVLKLLRRGFIHQPQARIRFEVEARMLHELDALQVVKVFEYDVDVPYPYMVMEYLGHGDLSQRIEPGGMSLERACEYLHGILQGLTAIHANGIVHRDLKPANVMFRYDDSLALTDFGIAIDDSDDIALTTTGAVVGTPSYISPEQAQGKVADGRSDLYAAGVIFYELMTGERPYKGTTAGSLFMQHAGAAIPKLPPTLAHVQPLLDRMMAKAPEQRLQSAGRALEALAQLGRG